MKKTLIDYCNETISNKLSLVKIKDNDINFGDTVESMYQLLIESLNNNKNIFYVKLTGDGIRFTYCDNVFYIFYKKYWFLRNQTQTDIITEENKKENRYNDFIGNNTKEEIVETKEEIKEEIVETKESFLKRLTKKLFK